MTTFTLVTIMPILPVSSAPREHGEKGKVMLDTDEANDKLSHKHPNGNRTHDDLYKPVCPARKGPTARKSPQ